MSDTTAPGAPEAGATPDSVPVTVDLPSRIVRDLEALVADGVHLSVHEAVRAAVHAAWRFERGTFHTLRLDLRRPGEEDGTEQQRPDEGHGS